MGLGALLLRHPGRPEGEPGAISRPSDRAQWQELGPGSQAGVTMGGRAKGAFEAAFFQMRLPR